MRKINRQAPPADFTKWVNKNKGATWEDFSVKAHDLYLQCRECLKQDQDGVSGYTEKPLQKEHIDHFKTRNLFHNDRFDWYNFVVDEKEENRFGSGIKDNVVTEEDYSNNIIINPITDNPHDYFTYNTRGEIIPRFGLNANEKLRAVRTIELFNLNDSVLVDCRCQVINLFSTCLLDEYTISDLERDCKYMGFFSLYDFYRENPEVFYNF